MKTHRGPQLPSILAAGILLCVSHEGVALDLKTDPQDERVTNTLTFDSFDGTLDQLRKTTGCMILCPDDTRKLMEKLWVKGKFAEVALSPQDTVRHLVEAVSFNFGLNAKFNPEEKTISVDIAWRNSDPRSAAELLQFVSREDGWPHRGEDKEWREGFNALLCKKGNFEKAAELRQRVCMKSFMKMPGESAEAPLNFLMGVPLTSVSGKKYTCIFFQQPMVFSPGHGSVSYYWFKEDGTLAGIGLMNTGHRCALVDASLHRIYADGKEPATEVHFILKFNNGGECLIGRFALEDGGLKLVRLMDTFGKTMDNSGYHVGEDLLTAEK